MPNKIRFSIVALCDAVYKDEVTNKIVIAGMYSGDILSDGTPQDMRFAMFVEAFISDTDNHDLDIQFWVGGRKVGGARSEVRTVDPKSPISILLPQFGITGKLPAILQIKAVLDGAKPVKMLEKKLLPMSERVTPVGALPS